MTQRSQPPADRPRARRDSTRPPRARRSADRAPYPGAATPTWSTGSPIRSRRTATTTRTRATTSTAPTPATVWSCGPDPIDPAGEWPVPIVDTVVAAFANPGARVLLLPWPTPAEDLATPAGSSGPAQPPVDGELAAAREAVRALGRGCEIVHLAADGAAAAESSRPFWADLVTDRPHPAPGTAPQLSLAPARPVEAVHTTLGEAAGTADLIITALPGHQARDGSLDQVALVAAHLLAVRGLLVVYTHSDWYQGRLVDPTGPMVAAGQNADLLYLQHIVTLHTPIRDGHLHPATTALAADDYARARHRAAARDLPAPHARTHSDLLLFAQPHDHHDLPPLPPGRHREGGPAAPEQIR